jgi:hypothetical protein
MKTKIIGFCICTLLIVAVIPTQGDINENILSQHNHDDYSYLFQNDAIIPPDIEDIGESSSPEPGYYDLSEFMIGTIALGIIFLESDGSIDPSTEDWTQQEKDQALGSLGVGGGHLKWYNWFSQEGYTYHSFFTYGEINTVEISYEPIIHPSAITDDTYEKLYVEEAMGKLGYNTGDWMQRVRDYANHLRDTIETLPGYYGTDWAFVVFLVDNSNDADGLFSDGYHAYAYLGGPFTVCPHLVPGGPPGPVLYQVFAHEMGHIFYATDEYDGSPDYSGYLNVQDVEGSGCIMDNLNLCVSSGSKQQVGWKDSDSDGRADILDTFPETTLIPYSPDPTSDNTPTYTGSATVQPMTNQNPNGPGNDITTNTVAAVEYRVDGGTWMWADPDDGYYDEGVETYTFTTPPLTEGTHTIETRATNKVGNADQSPASDTLTVVGGGSEPKQPSRPNGPASGKVLTQLTYSTSTTDPDNDQVFYWFDWGDGLNSGWVGPYNSGQSASASHSWAVSGNYDVKVKAKDVNDLESPYSDTLSISIPRAKSFNNFNIFGILYRLTELFPLLKLIF